MFYSFIICLLSSGVTSCFEEIANLDLAVANEQNKKFGILVDIQHKFNVVLRFVIFGLAGLFYHKSLELAQIGGPCVIQVKSESGLCLRRTPHLLSDVAGVLNFGDF